MSILQKMRRRRTLALLKRACTLTLALGMTSSAASAANATIAHVRDWLLGTPQDDWTSMAVVSDGSYGVPAGLVSSFPVRCAGGDWQIVQGLPLNAFAKTRFDASVDELRSEAEEVRSMGLLPR